MAPKPLTPLPLIAALALVTLVSSMKTDIPDADFVVVGGGTAGCAIAGELCRLLPRATITLLERGAPRTAEERLISQAPRKMLEAWSNDALVQRYRTTPNPAINNRTLGVVVGSNIGGGSAINGGQLILPTDGSIAGWGVEGLSDKRAQNLFNRLTGILRNTGLPPRELFPDYTDEWLKAARQAGIPTTSTPYVRPRRKDATWEPRMAFDQAGRRVDGYTGFVLPAQAGACRGRLRVLQSAVVDRVQFQNGARGVQVRVAGGPLQLVRARREVLMAAGAIESATILQRSGIGPRYLLRQRGIPLRAMLPVGLSLQTRPVSSVQMSYTAPLAKNNDPTIFRSEAARRQFLAGRGGPLGVAPFGSNGRLPTIGYIGMRAGFSGSAEGKKRFVSNCLANVGAKTFSTVRIASRDPTEPPTVDLKLLERGEDRDRLVKCVRRLRQIHKKLFPILGGTELLRFDQTAESLETREGLLAKLKTDTFGANHFVGSCAVGPVLDSRLRVRKVKRLRVVDSAAIPRIPSSAGPLASVYVMGMHSASLVAQDHGDLK